MKKSSVAFRGESGEVVDGFVSILTILTAAPVMLATIVLVGVTGFFADKLKLPPWAVIPLMSVAASPVVGLFAMAGKLGNTSAGFFDALGDPEARSRVPGFVLRYAVLAAAWGAILAVAVQRAAETIMKGIVGAAIGMGGEVSPVRMIWTFVAILAFALLAPAASLLVATRAEAVSEVFSPNSWSWLFHDRRDDLVPFASSYVGGMMLFLMVLVPPFALLIPIAMDVSPRLAQWAVVAVPMIPFAAAPILFGRLAGAFVASESSGEEHADSRRAARPPLAGELLAASRTHGDPQGARPAAIPGMPRPAASGQAKPVAAVAAPKPMVKQDAPHTVVAARNPTGLPLGVALARAHQLGETDPHAALAEVEALRVANARNPAVSGEMARLLLRCGRIEDARSMAAEAIRLALTGGAGPIAFDVFMAFAEHAGELGLDPATYDHLARLLCQRQEFEGAAWCHHTAAAFGGDVRNAQRGVLSVAEAATKADAPAMAVSLYEGFLQIWPDSDFAPIAQDALEHARRKVPVGASA